MIKNGCVCFVVVVLRFVRLWASRFLARRCGLRFLSIQGLHLIMADPPGSQDSSQPSRGGRRFPLVTCLVCNSINSRKRSIQCTLCLRHAHLSCVGIRQDQVDQLSGWNCPPCINQDPLVDAPSGVAQGVPASQDWGQLLAHLKTSRPIMKIIPKSVRSTLADKLASDITAAVTQSTEELWWKFLTFSYRYLTLPDQNNPSLQSNMASHIRSLLASDHPLVIATDQESARPTESGSEQNDSLARRIKAKCADGDIRAALRLLTSNDSMADNTESTLRALEAKHPPGPANTILPRPRQGVQPLQMDPDEARIMISLMPSGSGSGLDGIRPKHLQDMTEKETCDSGRRLLTAISKLSNLMLSGGIPDFACEALFGASLCALAKPDGGVRPIAIGSVYRRVTAKAAAKHATALTLDVLKPRQLGVGVPGGCEAAIHASREFARSCSSSSATEVLVKVDISNAFNSIHRASFLSQIRDLCPSVHHFMLQAYGFDSPLFYGSKRILSRTGLHQGDPLASLAFSLAINPIIRNSNCLFNGWYLDDGALGGELQQVSNNLRELKVGLAQIGLQLDPTKCKAVILSQQSNSDHGTAMATLRNVQPGIEEIHINDFTLLGSPVEVGGLESAISKCAQRVERVCERLRLLDAHWALFFLTRFTSAPRVSHILRTCPSYLRADSLTQIDRVVRSTLSDCTNVALSDKAWRQASLPLRFGGLGVRSVADLALPSYLSSLHASQDLVQQILSQCPHALQSMPITIARVTSDFTANFPQVELPVDDRARKQKNWDGLSCSLTSQALLDSSNQVDRARLLAANEPNSGAWLNAFPLPKLGLHLDDATVRVSIALRLGANICQPHPCRCGSRVDRLGHHGLACLYSAGRRPRHANLNDVVKRALAVTGIPSWLEPVGLATRDGRRPDGVTVYPYHQGKCLAWDATCVSTFCNRSLINSAIAPGSAAAAAEEDKRTKYSCLTDRYIFEPVAVEVTGVFGPSTRAFIQKLGRQVSACTGNKRETAWLTERISLAIVRGNAASIAATGCLVD